MTKKSKKDIVIKVFMEREEFYIPFEEHLKLKKKRDEDPDFDFDKELRSLAVKFSNGIPKWDN